MGSYILIKPNHILCVHGYFLVYGVAVVVVAMVGKFAIAVIFGFDYFWCSEMFPSTLRTSLVGVCSLFARIGSIAAPVIVDLVS